jgi:hypothetical protein
MENIHTSVKEIIEHVTTAVEAQVHSDLEYDNVCVVKAGLVQTWFEQDNTTLIVNAPKGGWHTDIPVMPNIKAVLEHCLEFYHQDILDLVGVASSDWDKLNCAVEIKETLTLDNPIARGVPPTERPLYLIISRTITDFDEAQRKVIIGYLIESSIILMGFLLRKPDLKSDQNITLLN